MPTPWKISLSSPCKDCPDRHEACWGHCDKYDAWREKVKRINAAEKEYKQNYHRDYSKSEDCQWQCKKRRYR